MKVIVKKLKVLLDNYRFVRENPSFRKVPYRLAADAFGHVSYRIYHTQGILFAKLITGYMRELNLVTEGVAVCEWGCGPARVIRHLPALLAGYAPRICGTDYNQKTVQWCRNNVAGVSFSANGLEPPLPFADDSFDFIYALSVFTHLSEAMHEAWLGELLRVVKPGGAILFTTHGEKFRHLLTGPELERYGAGKIVVREDAREGKKRYVAYHSPAYIRDSFLKGVEILRHVEGEQLHEYGLAQDVWIIRKRPAPVH